MKGLLKLQHGFHFLCQIFGLRSTSGLQLYHLKLLYHPGTAVQIPHWVSLAAPVKSAHLPSPFPRVKDNNGGHFQTL